jgi:alkanesulfonate monooxygenase SsuD/methylene tetrahydromethanopterin reductase-like flavin-dependent oxidoreductase (luciferase family)
LDEALRIYRAQFKPSAKLEKPCVMVGVPGIAADTDDQARRLFTSSQQAFANIVRGTRGKLRPPIDDIESFWTPAEKVQAQSMLSCAIVGSAKTVRTGIDRFLERTEADELMISSAIYDHTARLHSYEIFASLRN